MSSDNPKISDEELPTEFGEAIDGLALGMYSIEQIRAGLASILQENSDRVGDIQILLDASLRDGRLSDTQYETLASDIDRLVSEDAPTEWSRGVDEFMNEQREAALKSLGTGAELAAAAKAPKPPLLRPDASGPAPEKLGPGVVLRNRFRLESHIEAGSMGEIYKATDFRKLEADSADPSVAIKVISEKFSRYPDALKALQQEAANSQRLSHPNIVRVFDFDRHGHHFYMTMEWLDGESLVSILNAHRFRPLPFDKGKAIIDGICSGLIYAHAQGVVHADIKPGNIFVTNQNEVKLLDFGIARAGHASPGEFDAAIIGAHTPAYSSCEVLEGQTPTEQDDVYSLACIVYRIFAGRRAFSGFTALESESHGRTPKPIETLSSGQWQALKRAMAFRREDRSPDVASFIEEFSQAPRAEFTPHREETYEDEEIVEGASRLPFVLGGVASAAIAAVVAFSLWPREPNLPGTPSAPVVSAPTRAMPADVIELAPLEITDAPEIDDSELTAETAATAEGLAPDLTPAASSQEQEGSTGEGFALLAGQRMDEGLLVEPAGDNASYYLRLARAEIPDSPAYRRGANRLANLMMLEAMISITDKDFGLAEKWLNRARALDAEQDGTARVARELAKAREAEAKRETDAFSTIFASTTPAAVLGGQTADVPRAADVADAAASAAEQPATPAGGTNTVKDAPAETEETAAPSAVVAGTANDAGEVAALPTADDPLIPEDTAVAPPPVAPETPTVEESSLSARQIDAPAEPDVELSNELPLSGLEFTRFVEPKYPRRTSTARTSGWVEVRFHVNQQGEVDDVQVVNSEPDGLFDNAAIRAVKRWRFKPHVVDGVRTDAYSGVRLRFEGSE